MKGKICLAICGNFIQEFNKIISHEKLDMVEIAGLPCSCVQGYRRKSLTNLSALGKNGLFNEVQLLQCGGNGLPPEAETIEDGIRIVRHVLGSCFSLFANEAIIEQYLADGAYLTTPGWVSNWPDHLAAWGFDQGTAREFFAEFSKKIVLLDTGILPDSSNNCREFAQYLNLPCEIQQVGLDHCTFKVLDIVRNWELEQAQQKILKLERAQIRQNSEMATIFDLLAELTSQSEENEVVDTIGSMFSILFAPDQLAVCSIQNGQIIYEASLPMVGDSDNTLETVHARLEDSYEILPGERGFAIRFGHGTTTNGLAVVSNLAFPEKMTAYLSQAINLALVCRLAIDNSRALRGYLPICSFCKKIRNPNGRWQQMEVYISDHSQALFSHTYCEDCVSLHYDEIMK